MHKIPVTIITGFLGAGKTTLIRNLLQNSQGKKIAVLVNEFGEVGIDGDLLRDCQICDEENNFQNNIVELTNGCLCCTVQEEFYPVMQELLTKRNNIDCIIIETSGLALPKPLIQAFKWQDIRNHATVDGVISVVDGEALAKGNVVGDITALEKQRESDSSLEHETPIEELFEDQLACADLILLTKTDLIDDTNLSQVKEWLKQELRPEVKVIACQNGEINSELLLGFNAAVEDNLINRPSHHDTEEDHDHDDDIDSICIVIDSSLDHQLLINKLHSLLKNEEIYRIKGFINVINKPMRMVIQGVGDRLESFYDRQWKSAEKRETKLVFIGRYLNKEKIKQLIS